MSDNNFEEVTTTGYGGRLKNSFFGALFGLLLFLAAFPLEFWNEGRAVAEHQALQEGVRVVLSIPAQPLDANNAGKLVHVSGSAQATQPAVDPDFSVSANGLALLRKVEMYQWREIKESHEEKQLGGSTRTVTDYRYEIDWSEGHIDSSDFRHPEGRQNPAKLPFNSARYSAPAVKLGDFTLGPDVTDQLSEAQPLTPQLSQLPPNLQASFQLLGDALVTSKTPDKPQVGDIRVRFSAVPDQVISVIGTQNDSTLGPYATTHARHALLLVEPGEHDPESMLHAAEQRNAMLTWVLRGIGFMMMWLGLAAALGWIGAILDFIPILGSLIETGIGIVAALIAAIFSLLTIACAWLFYRPLLVVALIAAAVLCVYALHRRRSTSKTTPPSNAPSASH